MNSCLYHARVMHHRLAPKTHRFNYNVFMFYVDLDEITTLADKFGMLSRNTFGFFSFRDSEHLQLKKGVTRPVKENILEFLAANEVKAVPEKIMLLTNFNVLGYNFNPVSFYFCFDAESNPICAVAEVSNTFREMKPYLLDISRLSNGEFVLRVPKFFYVSPFINHDAEFDFHLHIPSDKLNIRIDDYSDNKRIFISTLTGEKKNITTRNLLFYALRFPLIPLRIMFLIHWNAFLLWMKKIRFFRKSEYPELQKDVLNRVDEQ